MKLTPVTCDECGAPMKVREDAKFVTCAHCETQLRIEHTEGAVSTVVLQKVDEMAGEIEDLRIEAEIARLDREWAAERESLMTRSSEGVLVVPETRTGERMRIAGVVVAAMFVGGWALVPANLPYVGTLWLLAAPIVLVVAFVQSKTVIERARRYEAREAHHRAARDRLLRRRTPSKTESA